jgi:pimeloyl-ACP methyl ester carboxylesterase
VERRLVVIAAFAFLAAAVLYSAWVPGQFANAAIDRTQGYLSELAARNQRWSIMFRAADGLAGLSCLVGVALTPRVRREWAGWLALALFGAFTVLDGLFPLDCAARSDPLCEIGPLSFSHRLHGFFGGLAAGCALVAAVLLARCWRTGGAWLLSGVYALASLFTVTALLTGRLVGTAQRAQVAILAIWLVYVAVHLLSRPGPPDRDPPEWRGRRESGSAVLEEGAGPAVLITSGMGGAWFHWDAVASDLAGDHRVIRFDRPGLGRSPAATAPPTLYAEAARLAALAPAHPEKAAVIAHSMGAWNAEAFARLHPLRVSRLVLVDPSCRDGLSRGTSPLGRAVGRWLPALGGTWGATAAARCFGRLAHRLSGAGGDREGVYREGPVLAAAVGEWFAYRDMALDLRTIRSEHPYPPIPTVVISAGRANPCHERLARALGAELVRLPDSGHQVHLDVPGVITRSFIRE